MKDELTLEEIETLVHEFQAMSKKFHEHLSHITKDAEITIQQYQLLHIISHEDNLNQKKIAEKLRITPATLSVRMKRLEEQEMVVRTSNENDKRHFSLQVTQKGLDLMKECEAYGNSQMMKLFDGITHEQVNHARAMFIQMAKNIATHEE